LFSFLLALERNIRDLTWPQAEISWAVTICHELEPSVVDEAHLFDSVQEKEDFPSKLLQREQKAIIS
jgi:hypothetical protein